MTIIKMKKKSDLVLTVVVAGISVVAASLGLGIAMVGAWVSGDLSLAGWGLGLLGIGAVGVWVSFLAGRAL